MSEAFEILDCGDAPFLIVADHASNHLPADIDLGLPDPLMREHIAWDIGVAQVARMVVERLGCRAILAGVSRLVIDLNREEDAPGLVPAISDGHVIPGNEGADITARLDRFYRPYHAEVTRQIERLGRPFILSLHSFTPCLVSRPDEKRPWEIGVLYNEDDRGARIAIPLLEEAGLVVGDQLPYSGRLLNSTMNRHAEALGLPYLGVEMRQDMAGTLAGQARFAQILPPVAATCHQNLRPCGKSD